MEKYDWKQLKSDYSDYLSELIIYIGGAKTENKRLKVINHSTIEMRRSRSNRGSGDGKINILKNRKSNFQRAIICEKVCYDKIIARVLSSNQDWLSLHDRERGRGEKERGREGGSRETRIE